MPHSAQGPVMSVGHHVSAVDTLKPEPKWLQKGVSGERLDSYVRNSYLMNMKEQNCVKHKQAWKNNLINKTHFLLKENFKKLH